MSRFELIFNDRFGDHFAECDWLVLKDGRAVAGFAGSNAAERFIEREEAADKAHRRALKALQAMGWDK